MAQTGFSASFARRTFDLVKNVADNCWALNLV